MEEEVRGTTVEQEKRRRTAFWDQCHLLVDWFSSVTHWYLHRCVMRGRTGVARRRMCTNVCGEVSSVVGLDSPIIWVSSTVCGQFAGPLSG